MKRSIRDRINTNSPKGIDGGSSIDAEMFGVMKRYKSTISENMLCNYFKDATYANLLWETIASTIVNTGNGQQPLPSIDEYIGFLEDGLSVIKANIESGFKIVESRVVVTDIDPEKESMEHTRLTYIISTNEAELNNYLLHTVEQTEETKAILDKLQKINKEYYELISNIRKTIIDNLVVVD